MNNQKIKTKFLFKLPGFTLVEMMTSMFIIVMITGIFTANYRANNKRTDLVMTAQKLVADMRLAQNNTMGLIRYGDSFPPGGWAVHFNTSDLEAKSKYIIFADLDAPASSDPGQESSGDYNFRRYNTDEGSVELGARVIDLPRGIVIDSLQTSNNNTAVLVNVNFLPPDPKTSIFDGFSASSWLKITLKDIQDDSTRTVLVNFLGLIEVID